MNAMRCMRGLTLSGVTMLAGCLGPRSNPCPGSNVVCPEDLVCVGAPVFCAGPGEVDACAGKTDEIDRCTTPSIANGLCSAGACTDCTTSRLGCRTPGVWTAVASPTNNALLGIWAAGPADIHAVGENGTLIHYDGVDWSTQPTALGTVKLSAIWGSGPSDLYALGTGKVFHNNGTWSTTPEAIGTSVDMSGLAGSAPDHVVVAGLGGTIRRFTGSTWTDMPASGTGAPLYAVWGSSSTSFYAAGNVIQHFDGTAWTTSSTPGANVLINAMWGDTGAVVAVGTDVVGGKYATYAHARINGTWVMQTLPERPTSSPEEILYGVWGASAADIFAVGTDGLVLHRNATEWTATRLPTPTLRAITGTSSGDVYAVGDMGVIWRYSLR